MTEKLSYEQLEALLAQYKQAETERGKPEDVKASERLHSQLANKFPDKEELAAIIKINESALEGMEKEVAGFGKLEKEAQEELFDAEAAFHEWKNPEYRLVAAQAAIQSLVYRKQTLQKRMNDARKKMREARHTKEAIQAGKWRYYDKKEKKMVNPAGARQPRQWVYNRERGAMVEQSIDYDPFASQSEQNTVFGGTK